MGVRGLRWRISHVWLAHLGTVARSLTFSMTSITSTCHWLSRICFGSCKPQWLRSLGRPGTMALWT